VVPASFQAVQAQQTTSTSDDYEECVAIIERFQVNGLIPSFVDAEEQCASRLPSVQQADTSTEADESGTVDDKGFILFTPPGAPDISQTHFKGANWLRFNDDTEDTNYRTQNIGWDLEYWIDMGVVAQGVIDLNNSEGVQTVIRLDGGLPEGLTPDEYADCSQIEIQTWMDNLDAQYQAVVNNVSANQNAVPIFILNNEPNHINPLTGHSDEGFPLTGQQYADLYNCYYERWRVEDNNPHYLFAAGPGQWGPEFIPAETPEQLNDPNYCGGCHNGWWTFLPELLAPGVLDGADGFAMHTYGYEQNGDPNGGNLFRPWTNAMVPQVNGNPTTVDRPILITEFNPGVIAGQDANSPPPPNTPTNWQNWFDSTYCWMNEHSPQIRGALYFVDEQNHGRGENDTGGDWWESSLRNHDDRRQNWLNTGEDNFDCSPFTFISNSYSKSLIQKYYGKSVI
jgi:hypothetical protein